MFTCGRNLNWRHLNWMYYVELFSIALLLLSVIWWIYCGWWPHASHEKHHQGIGKEDAWNSSDFKADRLLQLSSMTRVTWFVWCLFSHCFIVTEYGLFFTDCWWIMTKYWFIMNEYRLPMLPNYTEYALHIDVLWRYLSCFLKYERMRACTLKYNIVGTQQCKWITWQGCACIWREGSRNVKGHGQWGHGLNYYDRHF